MTAVDVVVESPVPDTARVRQLEGMFDVPRAEVSHLEWHGQLDLDANPWHVGLIVGPSGAGKTTIARQLWGPPAVLDWEAPSVVDAFRHDLSMEQIARICQAVGFNTIPAWMRPYQVLSTGEQFRVDLARRLVELDDPVVVDEFSSVVDRQVAQIGAHAAQKYVRANQRKFIAVTCHFDVVDWLQPDWVLEPASMELTWRQLQRRPRLDVAVAHVPYAFWGVFAPFHYLTNRLHRAATCFVLFVGDRPAAFAGVLHRPSSAGTGNIKGVSRLVTLPDWQGLGLAFVLADTLGAAYRALGWRLRTYPAHPALVRSFDRSPMWALKERPGAYMGFGTLAGPGRKASQRPGRTTDANRMLTDYQRRGGRQFDPYRPSRSQTQGPMPGIKREGQARRKTSSRRDNPHAEPWEPGNVWHQGARPNAIFEWAGPAMDADRALELFASTTVRPFQRKVG